MGNILSLEDRIIERDCSEVFKPGNLVQLGLSGVDISAINFIHTYLFKEKVEKESFTDRFSKVFELYSHILAFDLRHSKQNAINYSNYKPSSKKDIVKLGLTLSPNLADVYNILLNQFGLDYKSSGSLILEYLEKSFLVELNGFNPNSTILPMKNAKAKANSERNLEFLRDLNQISNELNKGRSVVFRPTTDLESYKIGFVDYLVL